MRLSVGRWTAWALLLLAGAAPVAARAQGFGLNEIGSCAIARGFAVTSAPCNDASVIFWNPGAATLLDGLSLYVGGAQIVVNGDFTQDTTGRLYQGNVPDAYPPHAFVTWTGDSRGRRVSVGAGFYVPYGLTSQWNEDFPGRFQALKASLATFYVQPNIAVELVPGWSIGGGPVFGRSKVTLKQGIDLASQVATRVGALNITFAQLGIAPGTEFARANLEGTATAWGFNLGLEGGVGDFQIGARYLSKVTMRYDDADATFAPVATGLVLGANNALGAPANASVDALVAGQFTSGALVSQKAATTIVHPWQAQFGIAYAGWEGAKLAVDVTRIGWSSFKELPVTFLGAASGSNRILYEDYRDNWSYRVGAEYLLGETASVNRFALRAGFSYVQTPAPDVTVTALLPDQDRRNYSIGIGVPLGSAASIDASFLRVETPGRRGRIVERTDRSQTAAQLNGGFYRLNANVLSLSLKAGF